MQPLIDRMPDDVDALARRLLEQASRCGLSLATAAIRTALGLMIAALD